MNKYTLKVQEVRRETDDTVTICFKQPGLKKIKYSAGQYLTLQFRINGRRYIRPYSFSSAPIIDSTLDITVKRVTGGIVSNYINDNVKKDDVIEVQEPLGNFTFEAADNFDSVVFWGVGSGITPLFSIIKYLLHTRPLLNIYLVYGNKTMTSYIFKEQIEKLKVTYNENFKVYNFYSKEDFFEGFSHNYHGRINIEFIENLLRQIKNSKHYICGPASLKSIIKESLIKGGEDIENISFEDFDLVKNPEDFKDIVNQEITLKFQGTQHKIFVNKGNSILEEALQAGLELSYSCQTGNCSTCKAKLKLGEMKMIGLSKPRTDLGENEYLLCCSYPLTNNIQIEI